MNNFAERGKRRIDALLEFYSKHRFYLVTIAFIMLVGACIYLYAKGKAGLAWDEISQDGATTQKSVATLREIKSWLNFWDLCCDICLTMVVACGIHLLYFWYVKTEEEAARKELGNSICREVCEHLLPGRNRWGLKRLHPKWSLINVFDTLKKGDEVKWLVTISTLNTDFIKRAVDRGVKVTVLAMDCGNAAMTWRPKELSGSNYNDPAEFRNLAETFLKSLASMSVKYRTEQFKFRPYRDLLGCPILLVKRGGKPDLAYSGSYLRLPSEDFLQFEWEGGEDDIRDAELLEGAEPEPSEDEERIMVRCLDRYFNEKWKRWEKWDLPDVRGDWRYTITRYGLKNYSAHGWATITQEGSKLYFTGEREGATLEDGTHDGRKREWGNTARCSFAEICRDDAIRFDYEFDKDKPERRAGVCTLRPVQVIAGRVVEMKGTYVITDDLEQIAALREAKGLAEPGPAEDAEKSESYAPRCGTIQFTRKGA